jgi:hypothetical protein
MVNRIRLAAAVLAAGEWPIYEQQTFGAHAVHPHAKATRQYALDYAEHPAVTRLNDLLPAGIDLSALFSTVVRCAWPTFDPQEDLPDPFTGGEWAAEMGDFYVDTAIAAFFWADHDPLWATAIGDLKRIFAGNSLHTFFQALSGPELSRQIVIMPNLVYPATRTVVASNGTAFYAIVPPPKAVGESPPWPYRDGADWVAAECCFHLLAPVIGSELSGFSTDMEELLRHAATIVYLERHQNEGAALLYRAHCQQELGLPHITVAEEAVRSYLKDPAGESLSGQFLQNL